MPKQYGIEEIIKFAWGAVEAFRREGKRESATDLATKITYYQDGMGKKIPEEWKKFIPPPTPEEIKRDKHPLQFSYCECGCKSYAGASKGLAYSIYWNLEEKNGYFVFLGHSRFNCPICRCDTFEQAVDAAQKDWDNHP